MVRCGQDAIYITKLHFPYKLCYVVQNNILFNDKLPMLLQILKNYNSCTLFNIVTTKWGQMQRTIGRNILERRQMKEPKRQMKEPKKKGVFEIVSLTSKYLIINIKTTALRKTRN